MRKLDKPTDLPEVVFAACISRVRNRELKERLISCEQEIIDDTNKFEQNASIVSLHLIPEKSMVSGVVSKDEMEKVYDRMVQKTNPGRIYYDKLITSPKNGICPLCGHRIVETLDHHLPKAHHPSLAVAPVNLIPACSDCNHAKLNFRPNSSEEEPIHPYFDDYESERWLYADVIQDNPVSLRYFVRPPIAWDDIRTKRITNHLKNLKLARLYSVQAATELGDMKHLFQKLFHTAGPSAVSNHLQDCAVSCEIQHKNYWKTAMYHALAECTWFHTEGVLY